MSLVSCSDKKETPNTETTPDNTIATTGEELNINDFFPLEKDVYMKYAGTGNEYAPYDRYVDYVYEDKIQIRNVTGGTTLINVYELKEGVLEKVFSQGEAYYKYDYTNSVANANEIILKEPIKEGEKWKLDDGATRRITSVDKKISTPLGEYNAIEITTTRLESVVKDYYVKDIGLIKTEFSTNDASTIITSEVEKIEKDTPLNEKIRFYYPQFSKESLKYIDKNIETSTNQDMKLLFEQNLKTIPENSDLTKVLSPDTTINSINLNSENEIVTVDFSKDLVEDMNTGAALEGMLLKSIVNTFGKYYQKEKVIITIEGKPYESGHFLMKQGEAFDIDFSDIEEYKNGT